MTRMLFEIAIVPPLVGGLLFVTKVIAKENSSDKALPENGDSAEDPSERELNRHKRISYRRYQSLPDFSRA
ncbi:hypothetical protein ACH50O_01800 [Methylomonas sp. 2BW1-5-20]|uniref:hypothetical protein n=1 Tax=Methylomonas sp. 2BW1-5-20 TaxID=3376686 RepID=UPI00404C0B13